MKNLSHLLLELEAIQFDAKQSCIELLDNQLHSILDYLVLIKAKPSGDLIELKNCSWVLHERYHMDTEAQLKWTFHHTKFRMVKSCYNLIEAFENKEIENTQALKKQSMAWNSH
jgi:hypothetical protein